MELQGPTSRRPLWLSYLIYNPKEHLEISDEVGVLANSLETLGISPMDAVHLALASTAQADFFTTCDDRLLRKAQALTGLACKVISVLSLVPEVLR